MNIDPSKNELDSQLDITSEPGWQAAAESQKDRAAATTCRQPVRIHFGCCRVVSVLNPPSHILAGKSDVWRVHCPRCGGLVEVLFK